MARKEAQLSTKIISKWVSKDTATGVAMVQRKKRLSSNCLLCNVPDEDTTHVLKCQSTSTTLHRNNLMVELEYWLKSNDTRPDITTFIISGLMKWFDPSIHILERNSLDHAMSIAFQNQQILVWKAFLYGLISSPIITYQQRYYLE